MNEAEFLEKYQMCRKEKVMYPNGGYSIFYAKDDISIIIDIDICKQDKKAFSYSLLTDKQNAYMKDYMHVYRFLGYDENRIDACMRGQMDCEENYLKINDRSNHAEASPLEMKFEDSFASVYGMSSLKYLNKEYAITTQQGNHFYLDYYISSENGNIAIEENGIHYHHPMIIREKKYIQQLDKQNACSTQNIKLYRFSSEDCLFENRIEDDIKTYIGDNTSSFKETGILAERKFKLYEHQEITLEEIHHQRKNGVKSFLVVLPTASGKSKIIEEDIQSYAKAFMDLKVLILVPTVRVKEDWENRVNASLKGMHVDVKTYASMIRHISQYDPHSYDYIVVDEAHHAVAPVLKRTIQFFDPSFLIGLTATDQRPDKKKLESIFGSYSTHLSLKEAMDKGIIAKANVYRLKTNLDLSKIRFNGKDYVNADLEKTISITSRNELIGQVLSEYFSDGQCKEYQGVIFCVNTRHASKMAEILNKQFGISAKSYTRESKHPEEIMQDFKNHKIRFLCACNMISEGWDYPELRIIVMARPTLSKVLYQQQIGRGLRKTDTKKNVFIIDVVDEYGAALKACNMHVLFDNPCYVPFGDISQTYNVGDVIEVDGIHEEIERIEQVDIHSFEEEYGSYLSKEQVAREYFVDTKTISSWIKKKTILPTKEFMFGSKSIPLFSKEDVEKYRTQLKIPMHTDETIKEDFFSFLKERDYSYSYKMVFLLSFIHHMNEIGDVNIDEVLDSYRSFYQDRIDHGLKVDRNGCPYTTDTLNDISYVKRSMLTNPFEKFERKRFMYYSKDLKMLSINHALFSKMNAEDWKVVENQMREDLNNYYQNI